MNAIAYRLPNLLLAAGILLILGGAALIPAVVVGRGETYNGTILVDRWATFQAQSPGVLILALGVVLSMVGIAMLINSRIGSAKDAKT